MIIDYPWYYVLLCLLAGAAYATALYFTGRNAFPKWLQWLLAALRFLAVSAIAFLLLAPVSRQTIHERQKPHVVLAADVSQSVAASADSAFSLTTLADELEGSCMVSMETFGGTSTDIGEALMRHSHDDIAALVLATDGIYNRGSNPATIAERLPFPVYTIALGDTSVRRDAALSDLRCNRVAMLGNDFPIEVTINALKLNKRNTTLSITDAAGTTLYRQNIAYSNDIFSSLINASLPANKPGLQRITVRLEPVEGEFTVENNTVSFYIDVIDTRRKVAIYANAPHPDLGALKRSIEANANYEASIIYASEAKADTSYSLAILHNLPSQSHPDVSFASRLPQIYVIGMQTDLSRFNALHSGLEINSKVSRVSEVTAAHQPTFSLFSLDNDAATTIEALPPLSAPFGEAHMTAGVQTLFTARLGNIDTRQPLIAATSQGQHRRAFIWGEGLWRWRLVEWQANGSQTHFDQLISQLIAFSALQQSNNRLQVEAARSYGDDESPALRAQLYNETYELTNTPEVHLHLSGDSTNADFTFAREGAAYRLNLPTLKSGLYHYTATTDDGLSASGSFAVEALNLEQRSLVADHNLLRTISATTGGEMYYPSQIPDLISRLSAIKPIIYTHTRYAEFLHLPLVLILIIVLIAAEWVLRKYHGEL